MAKRDYGAKADIIIQRVDKDTADTTFKNFVIDLLVLTLQEIISEVPYARWLLEEHSITLTADQQYVSMPSDMDIDGVVSLRDDSNDRHVIRVSPGGADQIDPGRDLSGSVLLWWFQRVGGADRLYFLPTPDATDSLTMISGEIITDPTSGQTSALPAKYESIEMEGAMSKLFPRIPDIDPKFHRSLFDRGLARINLDANRSPANESVVYSHRPNQGGGVPHGASFPADFDINP